MPSHRHYWVEAADGTSRRKLVARCECGWRSRPVSSGGLAGAAWDAHAAETRDQPEGDI